MNSQGTFIRATALIVSALLASLGLASLDSSAKAEQGPTAAQIKQQLHNALSIDSMATRNVIAARAQADAATATLAASQNRTDSTAPLETLSSELTLTNKALDRVLKDVATYAAESATGTAQAQNTEVRAFEAAGLRDLNALASSLASVEVDQSAVIAAVAARTAELQEQAAARAAAQEYNLDVWTSGFQAQLNACRGAVNLTAAYQVSVIGEVWQCGGSRLPREGTLIRLSGIVSGTYRVGPVVAVLDAYVDHTSDIPRGYSLLFQTCRNGNAHTETFTELIPVG